ncbi:MAG TPA: flagellar motor protein MotD [Gallionellaceae bacterium]|nr:flagellar motor protein MotD [Gallionellaceae bacterium]
MARRPRRTEPDNLDRWMISYADFITLLFAFFVVMYAISSVNEGKYQVLSVALNAAFKAPVTARPEMVIQPVNEQEALLKSLVDRRNARMAEQLRKQQEQMQNLVNNLTQVMSGMVKSGQVNVSQSNRGVVLDINASVLFEPGEARLQAAAQHTLAAVAQILVPGEQPIEVEGHTDDVPIFTPQFPSNWELSSARASSVVRLFIEQGLTPSRLTAVGKASYQPIASNDTADGRARNRRVTVTILAPEPERPLATATP